MMKIYFNEALKKLVLNRLFLDFPYEEGVSLSCYQGNYYSFSNKEFFLLKKLSKSSLVKELYAT